MLAERDLPETGRPRRRILGVVGAVAAFALAALWTVVTPGETESASGVEYWLLRWGHSVCWALLGVAALGFAADGPTRLRDTALVAAGVCYAGFILAVVV